MGKRNTKFSSPYKNSEKKLPIMTVGYKEVKSKTARPFLYRSDLGSIFKGSCSHARQAARLYRAENNPIWINYHWFNHLRTFHELWTIKNDPVRYQEKLKPAHYGQLQRRKGPLGEFGILARSRPKLEFRWRYRFLRPEATDQFFQRLAGAKRRSGLRNV